MWLVCIFFLMDLLFTLLFNERWKTTCISNSLLLQFAFMFCVSISVRHTWLTIPVELASARRCGCYENLAICRPSSCSSSTVRGSRFSIVALHNSTPLLLPGSPHLRLFLCTSLQTPIPSVAIPLPLFSCVLFTFVSAWIARIIIGAFASEDWARSGLNYWLSLIR